MKLNYLLFALVFGLFATACNSDDEAEPETPATCETTGLTYTNDIAAIINGSCAVAGCHNTGTTSTFPMGTFAETSVAVGFGRIIGSINHEMDFLPMPYPEGAEKLEQCTIDKITAWINDGAPE